MPSQPVTAEQMRKFAAFGEEAYQAWPTSTRRGRKPGIRVNLEQMKADGAPINIQEVVHVDPEFDEYGEPVEYAHDPKVAVLTMAPSSGVRPGRHRADRRGEDE